MIPGSFDRPLVIGSAAGNGNTTQVNILSFNIFNPQVAIGGDNVSHNTTINNVSAGNGNNSTTQATSAGGGSLFGAMIGNGNATQLAFASGNIFNPQWSLGGQNYQRQLRRHQHRRVQRQRQPDRDGDRLRKRRARRHDRQRQRASRAPRFVSNIFNPQFSSGNGNTSNNNAFTNDSIGNGNDSTTTGRRPAAASTSA